MNRFATLLPALILLVAADGQRLPAQAPHPITVQLLAINDLHGNLDPPVGSDGLIDKIPAGGVEYLATHLRNAARDNPNTLVIGAGDIFGGSPLLSALFDEKPSIEAANALHLSVTSIGNHELDHGVAELMKRLGGTCPRHPACPDAAHFQYLAGNVELAAKPGKPLFPATAIRTVGGVKIGFIGVTLEDTGSMLQARDAKALRFLEESSVANAAAAQLERQGVHTLVLLIHQGGYQKPSEGADPNGCNNFYGALQPILPKLSPSIKIVVSAHTHEPYNCQIGGRTVTSASSYGRMFTRLTLTIDPRTDSLLSVHAHNEIVTRDVAKDPVETAILNKYRLRAAKLTDRVVGSITGDIGRNDNYNGESPLGEVIADAELAASSAPRNGGAEIAFMNSTGIRAELVKPPGPSGRREVTYGDLYSIVPFGNSLTILSMTGDMIRRVLEQQFSQGSRYLEVSSGFAYRYRRNAAPGERILAGSITLNGHLIGPDDTVRVVTNNFLAEGGDGFTVFREARRLSGGPVDIETLVNYFAAHSPIAPAPASRVTRID